MSTCEKGEGGPLMEEPHNGLNEILTKPVIFFHRFI